MLGFSQSKFRPLQAEFIQFTRSRSTLILSFGLTEIQAQVAWEQEGVESRTKAKLVYDPLL